MNRLMTTRQAAVALRCAVGDVQAMCRAKTLEAVKKGSTWHVAASSVTEMSRQGGFVNESSLLKRIIKYLKALPRTYYVKTHGGPYQRQGLPDIFVVRRGRFFALELKTRVGILSPAQQSEIAHIGNAGGCTYVIRSLKDLPDELR